LAMTQIAIDAAMDRNPQTKQIVESVLLFIVEA